MESAKSIKRATALSYGQNSRRLLARQEGMDSEIINYADRADAQMLARPLAYHSYKQVVLPTEGILAIKQKRGQTSVGFHNFFFIKIRSRCHINVNYIVFVQVSFKILFFCNFIRCKKFPRITSKTIISVYHFCSLRFSKTVGMGEGNTAGFCINSSVIQKSVFSIKNCP